MGDGLLFVAVGDLATVVGAAVAVGADVGRGVGELVATGVLKAIGVQVGVVSAIAVQVAVGMPPAGGMRSICPTLMRAGLVIPLASARVSIPTPKREAISKRVSPCWTV